MPTNTNTLIPVVSPPGEEETAAIIRQSVSEAVELIYETWGLAPPEGTRILIMTSWQGFMFQAAPLPWRLLLAITLPVWAANARRNWELGAAWKVSFGRRTAIGIKPTRLLELNPKRVGRFMYEPVSDAEEKLRQLTYHELIHACTSRLKLTAWLNEGLALYTVDRCLGKRTIRLDTLDLLRNHQPKESPPDYRQLMREEPEAIAYHAVRGYWLVTYLEQKLPGWLKRSLANTTPTSQIADEMIASLGLSGETFWQEIDDLLVEHFST